MILACRQLAAKINFIGCASEGWHGGFGTIVMKKRDGAENEWDQKLPSPANMFFLYASTPGWSIGFTPSYVPETKQAYSKK